MKKLIIGGLVAAVVTFLVNGILAAFVYVPLFSEDFGELLRGEETAAGGFPYMIVGFIVMGFLMAFVYANMQWKGTWIQKTLILGVVFWLIVFADYLVVVGWSTMPEVAMSLSGLISGVGSFAGIFAVGLVYKREHTA